ncbi:MAG: hypothetical protein CSA45_00910 [Gammaproteobacteria bacterium]|nr:MAG: hypothetical protein CSA45_00910 [Gammaproteobacteria bacterium]
MSLRNLSSTMNNTTNSLIDNLELLNIVPINKEIKKIVEDKDIQWLCHFTPRSNLENIKKFGLLPRNQLGKYSDITATLTDITRYDGHLDTICLSISKPNKWMFEKKQREGFDLCLLLINPKILYEKRCAFYPHNAATKCYKNIPIEQFIGAAALETLFDNPITYQKSGFLPTELFRNQNIAKAETTSEQAEVQCYGQIDFENIQYIIEENIPLTYREIENFIRKMQLENYRSSQIALCNKKNSTRFYKFPDNSSSQQIKNEEKVDKKYRHAYPKRTQSNSIKEPEKVYYSIKELNKILHQLDNIETNKGINTNLPNSHNTNNDKKQNSKIKKKDKSYYFDNKEDNYKYSGDNLGCMIMLIIAVFIFIFS